MKKLLGLAFIFLIAACSSGPTESRKAVDLAASQIRPSEHENSLMYGTRVFSCSSDTGCQVGLLKLGDGGVVEFWFNSHHGYGSDDIGCTRFEFSDGTVRYLNGLFCCELMIEDSDLEDRKTFVRFIKESDGISP